MMLRGRGGGLVVQFEMLDWMAAQGITALPTLSIPGVERQFLDREGQVIQRFPDSTPFTFQTVMGCSEALMFVTVTSA